MHARGRFIYARWGSRRRRHRPCSRTLPPDATTAALLSLPGSSTLVDEPWCVDRQIEGSSRVLPNCPSVFGVDACAETWIPCQDHHAHAPTAPQQWLPHHPGCMEHTWPYRRTEIPPSDPHPHLLYPRLRSRERGIRCPLASCREEVPTDSKEPMALRERAGALPSGS
jgi:hypothetical protein